MKFYKYWAKATEEVASVGQRWKAERFGASNENLADAKANAHKLAQQTAEALRRGEFPGFPGGYLYSDRPVREEIVEEFGDDADPYALISRNAYGSLVLNTARILFADIDEPDDDASDSNPLKPLMGLLGGLLGSPEIAGEMLGEDEEEDIPTRVSQFVAESPGLGLRLYRTAAGYRCLVTSREFDPLSEETQHLLEDLGSDPLYVKLCQVQECFRARLTPKFWRCGLQAPPVRFPWADASQEQSMRDWEQTYGRGIANYATCELVEVLGATEIQSQIEPLVELHDRLCCSEGKPLA